MSGGREKAGVDEKLRMVQTPTHERGPDGDVAVQRLWLDRGG